MFSVLCGLVSIPTGLQMFLEIINDAIHPVALDPFAAPVTPLSQNHQVERPVSVD